jgi:hypothetical protein
MDFWIAQMMTDGFQNTRHPDKVLMKSVNVFFNKPLFTLKQKHEAEAEARLEACFCFCFMKQTCFIFGGRAWSKIMLQPIAAQFIFSRFRVFISMRL